MVKRNKKRSTFKKVYMKILMLPINLVAAILSIVLIAVLRGYNKAKQLDVKLESLEKGNKK
jgi:uncharacterized membrane protein YozB (DUF420 family)